MFHKVIMKDTRSLSYAHSPTQLDVEDGSMGTELQLSEVPMSVESGMRRGAVLGAAFG